MGNTWLIVGDASHVRILEQANRGDKPALLEELVHTASRMRTQDLESDRQGEMTNDSRDRQNAYSEPTDRHALEQERFAAELAEHVKTAHDSGKYRWLALYLAPKMLGAVRTKLPKQVADLVTESQAIDLVGLPLPELQDRLLDMRR